MNYNLNIILIIVIFYFIFKNKKESFSTDPDPDALTECNNELKAKDTTITNLANNATKRYLPVRFFLNDNKVEFCNSYPEFKTIVKSLGMKCP